MWRLAGWLDPETANTLHVAMQPLTKPRPGPDGTPDPRTPGQRLADALVQLGQWGINHSDMPSSGGRRPQIIATVSLAALCQAAPPGALGQGTGLAWLNNGDPISIPRLLDCAGQFDAALAVFGSQGELLH